MAVCQPPYISSVGFMTRAMLALTALPDIPLHIIKRSNRSKHSLFLVLVALSCFEFELFHFFTGRTIVVSF